MTATNNYRHLSGRKQMQLKIKPYSYMIINDYKWRKYQENIKYLVIRL